jgi:hypothetical protein
MKGNRSTTIIPGVLISGSLLTTPAEIVEELGNHLQTFRAPTTIYQHSFPLKPGKRINFLISVVESRKTTIHLSQWKSSTQHLILPKIQHQVQTKYIMEC